MADNVPTPSASLAGVIEEIVAEHGAVRFEPLVTQLHARGIDLGEDPLPAMEDALLIHASLVTTLPDRHWVWPPTLLAGRVFTHRVSEAELTHDVLLIDPDLRPFAAMTADVDFQRLADGAPVRALIYPFDEETLAERVVPTAWTTEDFLQLAPGYLRSRGCDADDLIGVRLTTAGFAVDRIGKLTEPTPRELAELRLNLSFLVTDHPMEIDRTIWAVCAIVPTLFRRPLPPLTTLLDMCGHVHEGMWLGPPGFDFTQWRLDGRQQAIERKYDLAASAALAVATLTIMVERVGEVLPAAAAAAAAEESALRFLADPVVAEAVVEETIASDDRGASNLRSLAETIEPLAHCQARAPLRWLRGRADEWLGEITRAEEHFLAAEALDPHWPPTLVDLARYASDRGDAQRAMSLLRRAQTPPGHWLMRTLHPFQRDAAAPLTKRAPWLYEKARRYLCANSWRLSLYAFATMLANKDHSAATVKATAMTDPFLADVVLFDSGALADFLRDRGALLPDDERQLAARWKLTHRRLYQVEDVGPEGLRARDAHTGTVHNTQLLGTGYQFAVGQLICARLLPAEPTSWLAGILTIEPQQRDGLMALLSTHPSVSELVTFLARAR